MSATALLGVAVCTAVVGWCVLCGDDTASCWVAVDICVSYGIEAVLEVSPLSDSGFGWCLVSSSTGLSEFGCPMFV